MAFNWKTFQTRTGTAIIFAAVMLTGLLWNKWSFLVLFSIIHFGCWWEYLKLIEKIQQTKIDNIIKGLFIFSGFILMIILSLRNTTINSWIEKEGVVINLKWVLWASTLLLLIVFLFQNKQVPLKAKWMCLGGFVYISLSVGLMLNLYAKEIANSELMKEDRIYMIFFPLFIIGCMWINDTMAYIVGSLIGRTPLSKISPKKTWEGTIGGILLSSVIMGYLAYVYDEWFVFGQHLSFWIFLAICATIFGTFGDLLESKLKRMAGVKDSGNIMPGHGGFLDRFDSLLLAIPAVWLYVYLLL